MVCWLFVGYRLDNYCVLSLKQALWFRIFNGDWRGEFRGTICGTSRAGYLFSFSLQVAEVGQKPIRDGKYSDLHKKETRRCHSVVYYFSVGGFLVLVYRFRHY